MSTSRSVTSSKSSSSSHTSSKRKTTSSRSHSAVKAKKATPPVHKSRDVSHISKEAHDIPEKSEERNSHLSAMQSAFKTPKKGPQAIRKLSSTGSQSKVQTRMRESSRTAAAQAKVTQPYKAAVAQRPDAPLTRFPGDRSHPQPSMAPVVSPKTEATEKPKAPAPRQPQGAGPLVPPEPQMRTQPVKAKEPEPIKVKPLEGLRPSEGLRPLDGRFPGDTRGVATPKPAVAPPAATEKPAAEKTSAEKPAEEKPAAEKPAGAIQEIAQQFQMSMGKLAQMLPSALA